MTTDELCEFLNRAGWSCGYIKYLDEDTGMETWMADGFRGEVRFIANGKTLEQALNRLRTGIIKMN